VARAKKRAMTVALGACQTDWRVRSWTVLFLFGRRVIVLSPSRGISSVQLRLKICFLRYLQQIFNSNAIKSTFSPADPYRTGLAVVRIPSPQCRWSNLAQKSPSDKGKGAFSPSVRVKRENIRRHFFVLKEGSDWLWLWLWLSSPSSLLLSSIPTRKESTFSPFLTSSSESNVAFWRTKGTLPRKNNNDLFSYAFDLSVLSY